MGEDSISLVFEPAPEVVERLSELVAYSSAAAEEINDDLDADATGLIVWRRAIRPLIEAELMADRQEVDQWISLLGDLVDRLRVVKEATTSDAILAALDEIREGTT